jgi:AcrR family transcriptional regulator
MVDDHGAVPPNRLERRKQRTRAALIRAAQRFIAAGQLTVPILDITQAADVGMGSFYNHFTTKEELFAAAVADVLDTHGELLDQLTGAIDDPAEAFACRFRLTGRLFRYRPTESLILLRSGLSLLSSDRGLAPRAMRDIVAASDAGRFEVRDPAVALAVAGGALMGLGQLLHDEPDRDDAQTADDVTQNVLRLFGMSAAAAERLCSTTLPDLAELESGNSGSAA